MRDKLHELLTAIYTATAIDLSPGSLTQAALDRGDELGLTTPQTYELLERLADENYIERSKTQSGSHEITYYSVHRITLLGVDVVKAHQITSEEE